MDTPLADYIPPAGDPSRAFHPAQPHALSAHHPVGMGRNDAPAPHQPAHDPRSHAGTPRQGARPRGGRRPGAGAPPGNLNAFRHGRRSRFAEHLTPAGSAVALADRLLARQRRALERQAATLIEVALIAQHERAVAHALETGTPPPPPPLLTGKRSDLLAIKQLLVQDIETRLRHQAGRDDPAPVAARARRQAGDLDTLVRQAATLLDRISAGLPATDTLAALLPHDQPHNQTTSTPLPHPHVAVTSNPLPQEPAL